MSKQAPLDLLGTGGTPDAEPRYDEERLPGGCLLSPW